MNFPEVKSRPNSKTLLWTPTGDLDSVVTLTDENNDFQVDIPSSAILNQFKNKTTNEIILNCTFGNYHLSTSV